MQIDKPLFQSDRTFQIYKYIIGHSQLLIRSYPVHNEITRIDILFKDVAFINLPATTDGVTVILSTDKLQDKYLYHNRYNIMNRQNDLFYVVAGCVFFSSDEEIDLEYPPT